MASFLRWLPPAYFAQYKNPNDNPCVHRDLPGITVFSSFLDNADAVRYLAFTLKHGILKRGP